jgi:cholesterol 7-dehydrogenase
MSSASHKEGAGADSALVDKSGPDVDRSSSTGDLSEPAAGKPALSLAYEHTQAPPAAASTTGASNAGARAASLVPWFHIPIVPELESEAWHYAGYTENIVPALLLEIPENGSDVAHLPALHARFIVPGLRWAFSHNWAASWTPRNAPGQGHIADVRISEAIALFGVELPGKVNVTITQVGPSQVFLQMHTPVGRATLIETVTPVSPLELRVLHALYVPRTVPSIFAKALLM